MATTKPDRTFELYPDKGSRYRWRARARNGQITAVSGEDFATKGSATRAARREMQAYATGWCVFASVEK